MPILEKVCISLYLGIFRLTAAAAAATASQELSRYGKAPGPSRAGSKYPVWESLTSTSVAYACRSEGFPNGIFHPCTLWARALARWKNCRRVVVAVVGVIWKMPKYRKMHTFSKMGMSEISRNVNLAEIKAPAGAS